jgi:hypothetical protein
VIDYHAAHFEETLHEIDIVLDTIGGETREHSWRVLRRGGVLVTLVSPIPAGVAEQHGVRGVFFIVRGNRGQLDQISKLVDEGKLKPVITWQNRASDLCRLNGKARKRARPTFAACASPRAEAAGAPSCVCRTVLRRKPLVPKPLTLSEVEKGGGLQDLHFQAIQHFAKRDGAGQRCAYACPPK